MNKKNKIFSKSYETRIIIMLFIVFVIGFFMGWRLSDTTLSDTQVRFEQTQLDLKSFSQSVLFEETFNSFSCDDNLVEYMSNQLYKTSLELVNLEKQNLVEDDYYELLKNRYNVNQVLFYTYFNKFQETCNFNSNMILYFFNTSDTELSNKQGEILDKIVEDFDVVVIPMDYRYNENLNYFYEYFEVSKLPYININYNYSFNGITSYEEIRYSLK
jgi:hypothetical protein